MTEGNVVLHDEAAGVVVTDRNVAIVRVGPSPGRCILPPVQNVSIPKHA